ncbi:MAG TPA: pyridoxamine 5'-phosphate oxidase family protein [Solirubrobacteraceae bacterium]|nr:pyridoxamine 5'-phosphate oxidase family protein [Solirubrobacteraceae bacterium]
MNRRELIKMTAAEVASFLAEERTVTCATVGPRGWPHLMPLWYVLRGHSAGEPGPRIWSWTYAASQKVKNLERDPRATLQVEAGEAYPELRGVMLECDVVIHREIADIVRLGAEIMLRNVVPRGEPPLSELPAEARDVVAAQAGKRVGLEFVELRRASWDHRKLDGVY